MGFFEDFVRPTWGLMYETANHRCPRCGHRFQTLADEAGMHECPRCGYHPSQRPRWECGECGGYRGPVPEAVVDDPGARPCTCDEGGEA